MFLTALNNLKKTKQKQHIVLFWKINVPVINPIFSHELEFLKKYLKMHKPYNKLTSLSCLLTINDYNRSFKSSEHINEKGVGHTAV